jgi:phosphatidylinositol glycan class P protein
MAPQKSRGSGKLPLGFNNLLSKSTPNLPTLRDFGMSADDDKMLPRDLSPIIASPVEANMDAPATSDAAFSDGEQGGEKGGGEQGGEQEEEEEEDDTAARSEQIHGQQTLQQRRLQGLRSSSSNNNFLQPSPSQLFPPFYGRPTTPLPPSPSLTSLLRPPFSTHTSRHTTPESSDVESTIGGSTEAAVENSAQTATTVPRASPKVPTYEYYGFALYLASSVAFLIYTLWAYLPSPFLHQLGIYYYPNRWWALAVPAWLVVLVMYIYIALASYNTGYLTLPMQSIENLVDEAAQIAIVDQHGSIIRPKTESRFLGPLRPASRGGGGGGRAGGGGDWHSRHSSSGGGGNGNAKSAGTMYTGRDIKWGNVWNEGTDAVLDIPIGGVCETLYGSARTESQ